MKACECRTLEEVLAKREEVIRLYNANTLGYRYDAYAQLEVLACKAAYTLENEKLAEQICRERNRALTGLRKIEI